MCTVTFLPKGPSSYILTSNRDETPKRAADHPAMYERYGHQLFFPKDPLAGGTWIVTDKQRFTLCLLNGAFVNHKRTPPYRLSRGQMVLEFFKYANVEQFLEDYNFEGIEPFTLVMVETADSIQLTELVWDGESPHIRRLDANEAYIWSSATLYPKEIASQRAGWFEEWLASHNDFEQQQIMDFHRSGGRGDLWNNFVMKRGDNLQTVSITSIQKTEDFHMVYDDLMSESLPAS